MGLACVAWLLAGLACGAGARQSSETTPTVVTGQPGVGDPSRPDGGPADPCGDRVCGLVPTGQGGELVACGWCAEGRLCRGGRCVVAPCSRSRDCVSESPIAGGLAHACVHPADGGEGTCRYAFDDQCEVLSNFQRIYQGAALYLARERVSIEGEAMACEVPASQGMTPIEETCCSAQGGPDRNGDDRCDADPVSWSTPTWADLGFALAADHRLVYRFGRDEVPPGASAPVAFVVQANVDQECNTRQTSFSVAAARSGAACRLEAPVAVHVDLPPGDGKNSAAVSVDVPLSPAQRDGFLPSRESVNPHFDEARLSLQRLAEGLAAAWRSGTPGACAFPEPLPISPPEGTCCSTQGGNDQDRDGLCDPRASDWQGGWHALGLAFTTEHAFAYQTGAVSATRAKAIATADLDCDTIQSTFARFVQGTDTGTACEATIIPGWYIENEGE